MLRGFPTKSMWASGLCVFYFFLNLFSELVYKSYCVSFKKKKKEVKYTNNLRPLKYKGVFEELVMIVKKTF